MNQTEKRFRLIEIQRSLAALPDELRTVSKAALPDTAERTHVKAALEHLHQALVEIAAALADIQGARHADER